MSERELIDSDRMYAKLLSAGNDYADKKAAYNALDAVTKSVLADKTQDYLPASSSRAEAEMRALSSREYRDHLANVADAHKAYLRAEVLYRGLQTLIELRRSEESTRRAEIGLR